jgi:hypothetical protein
MSMANTAGNGLRVMFSPRLCLTSSLCLGGGVFSGIDTELGFAVTNNTSQNIYLQTAATVFETIEPGKMSTTQTTFRDYAVRNNSTTNAPLYLTVKVSPADGSVTLESGTLRGKVMVAVNFA